MAGMAASLDDVVLEIRELDAKFERNAMSGSAKTLVEGFYAEDAVVLAPGAPRMQGRSAITAFWEGMLAAGVTDLTLRTADISASGDLAYGVGEYAASIGGERREGKYVVVYRRQKDGRYKAVVDSFSESQ